jgi:acid phosphatase type 7
MNERRFRGRVFDVKAGAAVCVLGVAALALALVPARSFSSTAERTADPVIAAAGDIACDPLDPDFNGGNGTPTRCHQQATAALLAGASAVLPLGDNQYEDGTLTAFQESYGLSSSWGAYNDVVHPVAGNHEYNTPDAAGYYAYYGAAAGDPAEGFYSFDLGSWHLVALNSSRGLFIDSPQLQWLRADLTATTKPCILAYWHKPRFSSGLHGNDLGQDPFWRELYAVRADVVLNGHDHHYERFDLQDPNARLDSQGIREFVVGTGGKSKSGFLTVEPNSQVRDSSTYGVLKLTLRPTSYDWEFVAEEGETFTDTGSTDCHLGPSAVKPSACRAGFWAAGRQGRLRYVCLRRWKP